MSERFDTGHGTIAYSDTGGNGPLLIAGPGMGDMREVYRHLVPLLEPDYRVVTFVDGLEHPWSIAFLPDGDVLVTEQPGRLRIVRDGALLPDEVPGVPDVPRAPLA